MRKEVVIKITLTDDNITLDGQNLPELTENDIIDSIKVLVTLAKTMNLILEGDPRRECPDCGCCCDYGSPCCDLNGGNIDHPNGCKKL